MPASTTYTLADAPAMTESGTCYPQVPNESPKPTWARDTQLEILAYEIARYDPDLTAKLIAAGKKRFAA